MTVLRLSAALACLVIVGGAAPRVAAADEVPAYTVVLRDGHITPAQIEVPARRKFKLVLRNEGRDPCELENLDLRIEKVLAAGANSFVVVHSLPPGRHVFVDEFHPDGGRLELIAR